jgi:hypothetical protein
MHYMAAKRRQRIPSLVSPWVRDRNLRMMFSGELNYISCLAYEKHINTEKIS